MFKECITIRKIWYIKRPFRFEMSQELKDALKEPEPESTKRPIRPMSEPVPKGSNHTETWMLALLLYNTCVAPMSKYCANSILQYGMDAAKYNVVSILIDFLLKEVIHDCRLRRLCSYKHF